MRKLECLNGAVVNYEAFLKALCTIMNITSYTFAGFRIKSFPGHSGSGGVTNDLKVASVWDLAEWHSFYTFQFLLISSERFDQCVFVIAKQQRFQVANYLPV